MTSQAMKAWTAFTTAFFALVAMLGFATPAKAAARVAARPAPADRTGLSGRTPGIPAVRTSPESESSPASKSASKPASKSASASASAAEKADPAPVMPLAWWALPKARSLPPTIKQRIRAEAHGSTPSTRRLPLDSEAGSDEAAMDAAVGEAVLQPA
ncbi:DUF6344 domain-containing protein [Streptomyces sp. NPDC051320]|uniref:DUF6344 domain-containing protein n=1 Tax=Streptomyces sp. NPDC051320 TaxID=3154644 RepID=UPI00342D3B26